MIVAERAIGPGEPPYLIAELGVNHDGDPRKALELVDAAAEAGCDAIKVQWFEAERLVSAGTRLAAYQAKAQTGSQQEMLRALELGADDLRSVAERARRHGLHAIATLFSREHVPMAHEVDFDAFKTASGDLVNRPLLETLMATGRPLFVSSGAATLDEVRQAVAWLGEHPHLLMQCVSAYPTPDECASLAGRQALAEVSPHALGYSDHTQALDTGALAVASGACVLEKHLTLDKRAAGPDHAASLEPAELAEYVRLAHRARRMLGPRQKRVLEIERDVREVARQSLVARRRLDAGVVLGPQDLTIKRPGLGLAPWRLSEALGKRLARALEAGEPLREDDLA